MRGADQQQNHVFSYLSPEERVRKDHPLLLFRWFVGLNADDDVWDPTVFTKNRDRLLEADVAKELLAIFTFACAAYNLVRLRNLTAPVPAV